MNVVCTINISHYLSGYRQYSQIRLLWTMTSYRSCEQSKCFSYGHLFTLQTACPMYVVALCKMYINISASSLSKMIQDTHTTSLSWIIWLYTHYVYNLIYYYYYFRFKAEVTFRFQKEKTLSPIRTSFQSLLYIRHLLVNCLENYKCCVFVTLIPELRNLSVCI